MEPIAPYWTTQQPEPQQGTPHLGAPVNAASAASTSTATVPPTSAQATGHGNGAPPVIKIACLACRKLKIRCNKPDTAARCIRCDKFNLECAFKEHARGQKRSANAAGSAEKESPTGSSPKRQKQLTLSRETSPDSSNGVESTAANVLQDLTAISEPPPPSWSLSALLNLRKPAPQAQYSDQFPDAVSLGILSLSEVEALFDFFFNEMNPFLGIFDRNLHTPEYVRNTSSLLFTAILAVATRHRFREAHFACLQQVHNHLDTILSRDRKRPWLPTIQALCTLAFWKESTDDGGWRRLGFAIRLAYEEGLHKLPKDAFSTLDKHSVRLALDRHRTWLYLCCMDQMMSFQRDLPVMIGPEAISDAATFIHLTPHALSEDWWLAAALEYSNLRYLTRSARVYCMDLLDRGQTSSADFFRYTARFDTLKADFERWRQKWIVEGSMFTTAVKSRLMLSFYASFMAFFISRTRTDVFSAFHDKNRDMAYERSSHANSLLECYSDAVAVLSSLQQISTYKYALIYLPDTVPVGACAAAVWLLNATKLEPLQNRQGEVRELLSAAAVACRTAAMHRSDTGKRLARFFESIIPRELPPLPPPVMPAYTNGTMQLPPPQQQQQHQDPQSAVQYGLQQATGFTPSSGFDFSNGLGNIFENNVGGNIFDPNLDLESFWSFYQTVDS